MKLGYKCAKIASSSFKVSQTGTCRFYDGLQLKHTAFRRNTVVKNVTLEPHERELMGMDLESDSLVYSLEFVERMEQLLVKAGFSRRLCFPKHERRFAVRNGI